ncbi:MAG: RNA polymerase factor sigma-54 [Candidatus Cloacimonetes bacterium]|jgi:RNA polymerase sigma-54 factor|nr:RNA polymerase factor sigma-54 [Candidatus Cloacimonadota bacterium]
MNTLNQNISMRQKQELALKPKMLQSLKMLSLPILELENYIKQELVNNPLLELRDDKEEENLEETPMAIVPEESQKNSDDTDSSLEWRQTLNEAKELTEILDQWNEYHQSYEGYSSEPEKEKREVLLIYEDSGIEKFMQQLYPLSLPNNEIEFIEELLDNCDSYGYLSADYNIERVAKAYNISPERANELHHIVLQLPPKGITARNISECLEAQLSEEERQNRILLGLCTDQFENLIHRRYQKIASYYGVSEDCILFWKDVIAKLDPKPGLRILTPSSSYIVPDIIIKYIDGDFEIIINDHISPNIIISPHYRKLMTQGSLDKETLKFVRKRINSAKFLIKSVYMRTRTLKRVTKAIIKYQSDFFYKGTGIIQPLTYSVIARELSVNESTVSRVVKHKYAETPYGIFALKDFFSSTAGTDTHNDNISRQQIKSFICRMVANEDKKHPLSDQELVNLLKEEGLIISRRIVAKYRFELGILNSRLRKM